MQNKSSSDEKILFVIKLIEDNRTIFLRNIKRKIGTLSSEDLEDCFQELYLTAYKECNEVYKSANPQGWLFQTFKNITSNFQRKQNKHLANTTNDIDILENIESPFNENDLIFSILTNNLSEENLKNLLLSKLNAQDYELYKLRYIDKLPINEIAKHLNIPEGTIKSRTHKLKQKIRNMIYDGDLFNFFEKN